MRQFSPQIMCQPLQKAESSCNTTQEREIVGTTILQNAGNLELYDRKLETDSNSCRKSVGV